MIVFDASTLILLAKIELLDILLENYKKEIIITETVLKECIKKKTFDALLIKKRVSESKIKVKQIKSTKTQKLMEDFKMNVGEAETILLAFNKKLLVGTDDKKGISACKILGIPFATAIDFVLRANEKKLINKNQTKIKLENLSIYGWYEEKIIKDAERRLK